MFYYTIDVRCPHCRCTCPGTLMAEIEPPPETIFRIICPNHEGPLPVPFRYFKPAEPFTPDARTFRYPVPTPPMLYYTIDVECPHCRARCPGALIAEVEPPPDTGFQLKCPSHGGPIRVAFRYFKPAEPFTPDDRTFRYPPPPPPKPRWWHFWKTTGSTDPE